MSEHASHDPRYHYLDDTPLHKLWTEAVGKPGYDKVVWSAVFGLIWARCPCGMEKRLAPRRLEEEFLRAKALDTKSEGEGETNEK